MKTFRILMFALMMLPAELASAGRPATGCGVELQLPDGWVMAVVADETRPEDHKPCALQFQPTQWSRFVASTPWIPASEGSPIQIHISYADSAEVLPLAGFEKDSVGNLIHPSGFARNAPVETVTIGEFVGVQASGPFRGFPREPSKIPPDQTQLYTGIEGGMVLKSEKRHLVLSIRYAYGTPGDELLEGAVETTIQEIIGSIKVTRRVPNGY